MDEFNYRPNSIAQSLRSSKTNMVGLIVADLSNRFFMKAVKGLEKVLMDHGYNLVVASSDGRPEKERQLIQAMIAKRMDALCIASVDTNGDTINTAIVGGTPIVLIDRVLEHVDTSQVSWNNTESCRILTKLLLENGHRNIAIVNVRLTHSVGRERLDAFLNTMKEAGVVVPKNYISPSNFSSDEAYHFVLKVMHSKRPPTALLCVNNVMMEGALKALSELGIRLYDDISLVTIGNSDWNNYMQPKITCIDLDSCAMGEKAGSILVEMINSHCGLATKVILSGTLTRGGSVRKIG